MFYTDLISYEFHKCTRKYIFYLNRSFKLLCLQSFAYCTFEEKSVFVRPRFSFTIVLNRKNNIKNVNKLNECKLILMTLLIVQFNLHLNIYND